jgi:hypothetical protein
MTTALNWPSVLAFRIGLTAFWIPVGVGAGAVELAMGVGASTAAAGEVGGVDPGATTLSTEAAGPTDEMSTAHTTIEPTLPVRQTSVSRRPGVRRP